uniref:Uncharacterized protein n=1 Tax=Knipowitschia caucasica TaxID=637954 RepID=A0AAV2JHG9_KNICA
MRLKDCFCELQFSVVTARAASSLGAWGGPSGVCVCLILQPPHDCPVSTAEITINEEIKSNCSSGPRLGARPTPLRDPQLQPRRRLELAARTAARSFSHRAELNLPVPQRRNCAPTPTKKEHRGPSRLKPPPGFPCVGKTGVCVRPLSVREED